MQKVPVLIPDWRTESAPPEIQECCCPSIQAICWANDLTQYKIHMTGYIHMRGKYINTICANLSIDIWGTAKVNLTFVQ